MIGVHIHGIDHSYKKLKKTEANCLACGKYSECQIMRYTKARHIFYIKTKILDEKFIFDWAQCNHRVILYDPQDVHRYKMEQVETGILSVPYYQNMKLQITEMPKKVSIFSIILVLLLSVALAIMVLYLQDLFNIPFIP